MKKLQNRKGFTLVELLIVMAIIGILMLIAIPQFTKSTQSAQLKNVQSNVRTAVSAAGIYYADNNNWPDEIKKLIDGNYLDKKAFGATGNADGNPKAVYTIDKAKNTIKATITLNKLPVDADASDYTTIAAGGLVTVEIPFAS